MKYLAIFLLVTASAVILTACSSGDSGTTVAGGGRGGAEYGFITLSITDAPVDYANEVRVQFDGVEFMPSAGSPNQTPILVMLDTPMNINPLELQGDKSKALLTDEILPTGYYDWVNLKVTALNDGILDSYIVLDDGSVHELELPPDSEVGLTIVGGLEVIANTPSAKTIDFDLRKSIVVDSDGNYQIEPTLSLVDDGLSGSISGTINPLVTISSHCSDSNPLTGNAVYLYEDFNVKPDDMGGAGSEPVASALVKFNDSSFQFEYSFGFVPLGKYTATFTCAADLDEPASDDAIAFTRTRDVHLVDTATMVIPTDHFEFVN